jgi:cell wall-associated NlpC family hydrolase
MKAIACALPLLAGITSVLSGQIRVGTTLGPVAIVASFGRGDIILRAMPRTTHRGAVAPSRPAATASASRILATAERYLGVHYRYGGGSPSTGFDCSGFVQYVFGRNGVQLPRTSRQQATAGRPLAARVDRLRPGDLMLFASRGGRIDHVAIYAGNDRMIHSSSGMGKVVSEDLTSARGKWYLARYVASRRVL